MNRKSITIFLFSLVIYLLAGDTSNYAFDFYFLEGYKDSNEKFILHTDSVNKFSLLTGEAIYTGGKFGSSQYEISLQYSANLSHTNLSSLNINQLYIETPLFEFLYLTVGKRKKEFGLGTFYNFSNLLSPKKIIYNKIYREVPGLLEIDWIASKEIALGAFMTFNDAESWDEISIGNYFELNLDNFYSSIYLYNISMNRYYLGFNILYQAEYFRLYSEGIVKEKGDQAMFNNMELVVNNDKHLSISNGLAMEIGKHTFVLECTYRSEGYSQDEMKKYYNLIDDNIENYKFYIKNYFSKNYFGLSYSKRDFIFKNLSFNLSNQFTLNYYGGITQVRFSYLHSQDVIFAFGSEFYYGEQYSEYKYLSPENITLFFSIGFSY